MDVCRHYFNYESLGGCGIPRVDLMGTSDDWRLLREKAGRLVQFTPPKPADEEAGHLSVWLAALLPALDHFVAAAEGHPDLSFWGSVCNLTGYYGDAENPVTGWLAVFFPYIGEYESPRHLYPNPGVDGWLKCFARAAEIGVDAAMEEAHELATRKNSVCHEKWFVSGVKLAQFPPGLAAAPVLAKWPNAPDQDMKYYGGVFAIHQHPDGALEPRSGWAVVEVRKPAPGKGRLRALVPIVRKPAPIARLPPKSERFRRRKKVSRVKTDHRNVGEKSCRQCPTS
jgi:hypothetical protein